MIVYPDKSPGIYLFMFYLKSGQVRRLTVAYEDFVKAPWRFMFDLPEGTFWNKTNTYSFCFAA